MDSQSVPGGAIPHQRTVASVPVGHGVAGAAASPADAVGPAGPLALGRASASGAEGQSSGQTLARHALPRGCPLLSSLHFPALLPDCCRLWLAFLFTLWPVTGRADTREVHAVQGGRTVLGQQTRVAESTAPSAGWKMTHGTELTSNMPQTLPAKAVHQPLIGPALLALLRLAAFSLLPGPLSGDGRHIRVCCADGQLSGGC